MTKGPHSDRIGVARVPEGSGDSIADAARKASERLKSLAPQSELSSSSDAMTDGHERVRDEVSDTLVDTPLSPPRPDNGGSVYQSAFKIYHKENEQE